MTTPFGLSQDLARGRIGINSELRVHHVTRTVEIGRASCRERVL